MVCNIARARRAQPRHEALYNLKTVHVQPQKVHLQPRESSTLGVPKNTTQKTQKQPEQREPTQLGAE